MPPNYEYLPFMTKPPTGPNCLMCKQTRRLWGTRSHIRTDHRPGSRAGFSATLVRSPPCAIIFQSWYAVISDPRNYFFNCSKAPKAKNPNPSGLGRAIINRRAKDARQTGESSLVRSGRISSEGSQPCLLVHNRHRSILSFAVCHPGR
jgi:hypothetical protein